MSINIQEIDYSVNLLQSLLWQHNNATKLTQLVRGKQDWFAVNQSKFWSDWIVNVFDLRTANAFGLKVWSVILDMPINIVTAPTPRINNDFGFGVLRKNFGHGTFGQMGSGNINVTLEDARIALRLRYFKLICRPTIPQINQFLSMLFTPRGTRAYVVDNFDMTFNVVFENEQSATLLTMLSDYDVLPRPATVGTDVSTGPITTRDSFGFGPYNENFGHGTFFS